MTENLSLTPDYILETSWEVCNKVGGIYTVLSTRAGTMISKTGADRVIFLGPWLSGSPQTDFVEDTPEALSWLSEASELPVKVGHWRVPGNPLCILIDYKPLYTDRDTLYFTMWEQFGIRGELGYGDYDDSCLFAIAVAKTMMLVTSRMMKGSKTLAIFNEWTTGMGLLYLKLYAPEVSTFFITHATTVGRSISGNGKPLYNYMSGYFGDQMADELNVRCKHQVEKAAAHAADSFGVVSELTAVECRQLLEKDPDVIVPNGFERGFVPPLSERNDLRKRYRKRLLKLAQTLYGTEIGDDALLIATSGRFEFHNKGLDIYLDVLRDLAHREDISRKIVAFILVPGWIRGVRQDLRMGVEMDEQWTLPMQHPYLTHYLNDALVNPILRELRTFSDDMGKDLFPVYIPAYLSPYDGLLNAEYYGLLPAMDLTIFPSYYEPWGYTPLESIAMGVPTCTTDKSGFGMWATSLCDPESISDGVRVLHRTDDNHDELVRQLVDQVLEYDSFDSDRRKDIRKKAEELSHHAYWSEFYGAYGKGYRHALEETHHRLAQIN